MSKKFEKEISQPLQLLADASTKIKEKDLDFSIDYHADNELGKLCAAFSEMQEELKKYLAVIQENAEKSASLIKQMQYTSELENRDMKLNTIKINIREFMEQKVQSYQLKAQQKSIELVLSIDKNVPDYVQIDSEFLARILDNLLSNSLQYTPSNGRVEVKVNVENGQL